MVMDEDESDQIGDGPRDRPPEEIEPSELRGALFRLQLLGDDPYLRMQVFNLALVDPFLTQLERQLLEAYHQEERTPIPEAAFLSALSQMWIFATYEIMRTWRQRANDILKWAENSGLEIKLQALKKDVGYQHIGRQFRAKQIEGVLADPSTIERIREDLRRTHMLFARLEAIRVSIAKHEVKGRKNSVALRPGYGRINDWSGSLDYELENGAYSMGYTSRRDIADEIRSLLMPGPPPADEVLAQFDAYMRGPTSELLDSDSSRSS